MAQTCWPAAPPKPTSAQSRGSTPRATETSAMAWAMLALATSTKPAAISSGRGVARRAQLRLQRGERALHRARAQREGEAVGLHAPEGEVHVGERELAAGAGRP